MTPIYRWVHHSLQHHPTDQKWLTSLVSPPSVGSHDSNWLTGCPEVVRRRMQVQGRVVGQSKHLASSVWVAPQNATMGYHGSMTYPDLPTVSSFKLRPNIYKYLQTILKHLQTIRTGSTCLTQTQAHRHIDTQTQRHTNKQTNKQTTNQPTNQTNKHTHTHTRQGIDPPSDQLGTESHTCKTKQDQEKGESSTKYSSEFQ